MKATLALRYEKLAVSQLGHLPAFPADQAKSALPVSTDCEGLSNLDRLRMPARRSALRDLNSCGPQETADRIQEQPRRLQLRDMGAARNDFQMRLRQQRGQFMRHRRRRRLVMFADHDQHRHFYPGKF